MLEKLSQRVSSNLDQSHGYGVPWEVILPLIIQLLECLNNRKNARAVTRGPSRLQKAVLRLECRAALRDEGRTPKRGEIKAMVDELVLEAGSLSENEFDAAYDQAQVALGGPALAIGAEGNEDDA
jgi:hypothetical protein